MLESKKKGYESLQTVEDQTRQLLTLSFIHSGEQGPIQSSV